MSHDEDVRTIAAARALNDALRELPVLDRVTALAASIIDDEPRAPSAIAFLISVIMVMTKHLPEDQRIAVRWHLAEVLTEVEAKWH